MRNLALATIAALIVAAPASATIITYSAEGGGFEDSYQYTSLLECNDKSCGPRSEQRTDGIKMSGTFSLDTSRLKIDYSPGSDRANYSSGLNGGPPSMGVATKMTLSGGHAPIAVSATDGSRTSALLGIGNENGADTGYFSLRDFAVFESGTQTYNPDGSYLYLLDLSYNGLYTPNVFGFENIDGFDIPIDLGLSALAQLVSVTIRQIEFYSADGTRLSLRVEQNLAYARLTSLTVTKSAPTTEPVPEPSVLGLFGLGLVGLSLARRQKA